jgi:hypothetical protein
VVTLIKFVSFRNLKDRNYMLMRLILEFVGCIDKTSSAELSEAINSMYRWYRNSQICFVYLVDVPEQPKDGVLSEWREHVRRCRWLRRGWTLQEMLAPEKLIFFSSNWKLLEDDFLVENISQWTGIPARAIQHFKPSRWTIAQRMSWAAHRETTRIEDRAYSLLGLFSVNMPLLYGEGERAFLRLQEEIMKTSTDQTIFCWRAKKSSFSTWRGLLARDPSEFEGSEGFREVNSTEAYPLQIQATAKGLQMLLPLQGLNNSESEPREFCALLNCFGKDTSTFACIWLRRVFTDNWVRVRPDIITEISLDSMERTKSNWAAVTVYAKPDLETLTWSGCDMCPRIRGFYFAKNRDDDFGMVAAFPSVRFNHNTRIFLFGLEGSNSTHTNDRKPNIEIAKCRVRLFPSCEVELLFKFDGSTTYGVTLGIDTIEEDRLHPTERWNLSHCCEWRITKKSCDYHNIDISSCIELNQDNNAVISIEVHDNRKASGQHSKQGLPPPTDDIPPQSVVARSEEREVSERRSNIFGTLWAERTLMEPNWQNIDKHKRSRFHDLWEARDAHETVTLPVGAGRLKPGTRSNAD